MIANRGLAGIDGTVSTAIGAALARPHGDRNLALMGDVTFLHDANGLVHRPRRAAPRPDDRGRQRRRRLDLRDARAGRAGARRPLRPALRHPARRRPGRLCAATRTPHWRVDSLGRARARARHAQRRRSRSSRSSSAATTAATSTPGSAPCGPDAAGGRTASPAADDERRGDRPAARRPGRRRPRSERAGRPARLPGPAAADRRRRRGVVRARRPGDPPRARGGAARAAAAAAVRHRDPELAGRLQRQPAGDPAALGRPGASSRPLGVGVVVHAMLPAIGWALAFAIGAVVAPPDAVAATAIGRRIGLPRRVVTILEGESLLNDATALVALRTATAVIVVGGRGSTPGGSAADFVWAAVGGVLVGVRGLPGGRPGCASRSTDPVLDTGISFVIPFVGLPRGRGDPRLRRHRRRGRRPAAGPQGADPADRAVADRGADELAHDRVHPREHRLPAHRAAGAVALRRRRGQPAVGRAASSRSARRPWSGSSCCAWCGC